MKLSGDFISSIRAKNKIVGNIKDITLQDLLLDERLKPYWSLSKDKIGVCKDCEYLYVCDYHGIWTTKSNLLISRKRPNQRY